MSLDEETKKELLGIICAALLSLASERDGTIRLKFERDIYSKLYSREDYRTKFHLTPRRTIYNLVKSIDALKEDSNKPRGFTTTRTKLEEYMEKKGYKT